MRMLHERIEEYCECLWAKHCILCVHFTQMDSGLESTFRMKDRLTWRAMVVRGHHSLSKQLHLGKSAQIGLSYSSPILSLIS